MEDKIEIGEYVRTKDGKFGIFDRYSSRKDNSLYKSPFNCFVKMQNRKTPLQCCREYIVKHSKNRIELIEEGDYVNGYKVLEIRKHFEVQPYRISIMVYKTKDAEFWKSLEEQDIKDIVTHEQFDSVKYITEEEK